MSIRKAASLFVLSLACGVGASAQQIKNAIPDVARPLPLSAVRLTGGPLKHAQDLNAEYLLKILHNDSRIFSMQSTIFYIRVEI